VLIATDSQTDIVFRHPPLGDPYGAQVSDPSGWNIYDVRFAYDAVLDTAYFGINTGPCITGDADCDGDAGSTSAVLLASDGTATDNPVLDKGEFLVITLDFGVDNRAVFSPAESNPVWWPWVCPHPGRLASRRWPRLGLRA